MRHLPRWMLFAVFVLILAIGAMSSLAVVTTRESFPQTNGRITVDALGSTVEVKRDGNGVPHIYADTPEDLFAAQGFVHAQDRFFEMDLRRHITSGRLAELFGEDLLATDTYVRTLGWRRVAEQEAAATSGATRRYLDAYAKGVNSWLATRSGGELSLEYAVLGLTGGSTYRPEPWTAADSLAWFKAMAWNLDGNRLDEIERALAVEEVGATRAAQLWPAYDLERFSPIVTRGAIRDGRFDPEATSTAVESPRETVVPDGLTEAAPALRRVAERDRLVANVLGDPRDRVIGSNSWVLGPDRTSTGSAILSNDPHLATGIPSTFTQVGLHCNVRSAACPFDVTGFSFSGVPGVIIGKNADIAWGMTTPYIDTQDLFLEQIRGDEVRYGGRFEPLTVRTEQLRVKGEDEPRTITIRSTRHGPLLSDVDPETLSGTRTDPLPDQISYAASIAWTALQPSAAAEALFGINAADDFESFRAAARNLGSPSQNLVYADRQGNIGYQLPGTVPTRNQGDGTLPRPGWDPGYDWGDPIPFEQLPWDYNPPSGAIVAANQSIIGPEYGRLLGTSASYGWRSQMIVDRLAQRDPVAPEDSVEVFSDATVGLASDLVPILLRVRVDDPWVADGQRTLVGWDYEATADSAAAAYYSIVYRELLVRTFADEIPQIMDSGSSDRWFSVIRRLLADPDNEWWDDKTTDEVETRDDILLAAMTDARKEITVRLSQDPSGWRWGRLHTATLRHPSFGDIGIAPLESVFNRGPVPVDGSAGVINAMAWRMSSGDFTVASAPTMRMMIDFAEPDESQWINQSGVSGHASHPNYDDQFALWARGETLTMRSTFTAIDAATVNRLELVPIG